MDIGLIFGGNATPFDLMELYDKKGYEFTIEDGKVTKIIC